MVVKVVISVLAHLSKVSRDCWGCKGRKFRFSSFEQGLSCSLGVVKFVNSVLAHLSKVSRVRWGL